MRPATDHISDERLHEHSQGDLEEPRMDKVEEHLYRKRDEPSEHSLEDRRALHPN